MTFANPGPMAAGPAAAARVVLGAAGVALLVLAAPLAAQEAGSGGKPATAAQAPGLYLVVGGEVTGPWDQTALEAAIRSGTLTEGTMGWMQGMEGWAPVADIPAVAALLAVVPGPVDEPKPVPEPAPEPAPETAAEPAPDVQVPAEAAVPAPAGFTVDDPGAYLAGQWSFQAADVEIDTGLRGDVDGEVFFTADGRMLLRQNFAVTVPRMMTIEVEARGTYSAEILSPTHFVIHPQMQASFAVNGVEQGSEPLTEDMTITVIGADMMRDDENMVITRVE